MHQGQKKRFVSLEFITHFSSRDSKQKKINFPKTLKQMSSSFSILYSGNLVLTTSLKRKLVTVKFKKAHFRALALRQSNCWRATLERVNEGLTLETSAFLLFTVANLRFQPSC